MKGATVVYDPDHSDAPYTPAEFNACQHVAPSPVMVGQRVLYRHTNHGDATEALVVDIDNDYPTETWVNGMYVPLPPWPNLTLDTLHGRLSCRESRARGAAGWLPVDTYDGIAQ